MALFGLGKKKDETKSSCCCGGTCTPETMEKAEGGYPACPDHSLKREVFDLLAADKTTAMRLNDNYMITPEEALCGLFFADAEYFSVGRIDREQLADYAARRNMDIETIEKLIPNNI